MDWLFFKYKKILITGHTGFKGSWLMRWLEILGAEVIGISLDIPTKPSNYEILKNNSKIKDIRADIRNLDNLIKIFEEEKPDMVFHLAAQSIVSESYEDMILTFNTNTIGSINIMHAATCCKKIPTLLMITSDKCYKNNEWCFGYRENDELGGDDPYSASKAAAEILIKSFYRSFNSKNNSKLKVATARAGNVIGGGDWAKSRIVPDCMRAWSKSEKVSIRSPKSTRPWQHVLEPLGGYLLLMQKLYKEDLNKSINGESFNFGPSLLEEINVGDLVQSLAKEWGKDASFELSNSNISEAGLLKLNFDKANSILGWRPVFKSSDTFTMTANWYKVFYKSSLEEVIFETDNQIAEAIKRLSFLK